MRNSTEKRATEPNEPAHTAHSGGAGSSAPGLVAPYMFWAHTHSARTSAPLSQSGMPLADAALLGPCAGFDVGHPSAEALPELERAVARHLGIDPARVLVTLGATGGMFLCAWRWFGPGSRVLTDRPSYEPFRALPRVFGAATLELERRLEDEWRLAPAEVERALAGGSGPAHVFTANPHNPTGALSTRGELVELAALAARTGGNLVECEVYMEYAPRGERMYACQLAPNAVSIGSLTKAYGLGALRAGWIALGEGLAHEAQRLRDLAYLSSVDPATMAMQAARAAFANLDALWAPVARNTRECRPAWARWLRETETIASTVPPYGIIAFPRVHGAHDTLALCEYLVHEHEVDVVPGEYFGATGHVRVGCGVTPAQLETGLARLARGLAAWRDVRDPAAWRARVTAPAPYTPLHRAALSAAPRPA